MMCIVLDTNVFVSGLFGASPPLKFWMLGIKTTTASVLTRDFGRVYRTGHKLAQTCSPEDLELAAVIELVTVYAQMVIPIPLDSPVSRDPDLISL